MTYLAIAGDPAKPGESMPPQFKKRPRGSEAEGSITQSPREDLARTPQKEWIVSEASKEGTNSRHLDKMKVMMSSKDSVFVSASSTSRAVGPKIRLPHRVFCTSTPLPFTGCGVGKIILFVLFPWFLWRSRYSPRRGFILNDVSPIMPATLSDATPAQLIT